MGNSKYNPIYEFSYTVNKQNTTYRVTSVLGHLMGVEFPESCKDWHTTPIEQLYHVPLLREPIETSIPVYKNLEHYSKKCDHLVIWTDCDREGEAIGYDIIDVCKKS